MKEDLFFLGCKACIFNTQGHLLLLKKPPKPDKPLSWDLPGGRVDKLEEPIQALVREVYEETGITGLQEITEVLMTLTDFRIPYELGHAGQIFSLYRCVINEPPTITLSHEHIDYEWMPPEKAASLLQDIYPKKLIAYLNNCQHKERL